MHIRKNMIGIPMGLLVAISLLPVMAKAQEKQDLSYTVGPGAVISITNNYGPITVRPS